MTNGTQTTVYFGCPHCATTYVATQAQCADPHSGDFYCKDCGAPVHSWTGYYDFSNWTAFTVQPVLRGEKI
jgi:predicted RNA-binding Zn-ribbon protein involved in translation (DUF1610 family)